MSVWSSVCLCHTLLIVDSDEVRAKDSWFTRAVSTRSYILNGSFSLKLSDFEGSDGFDSGKNVSPPEPGDCVLACRIGLEILDETHPCGLLLDSNLNVIRKRRGVTHEGDINRWVASCFHTGIVRNSIQFSGREGRVRGWQK